MLSHYEKEWTMEKLCERANMEKSQFYSYYKKFFSSTPHNDLIEVRLDKAKNLLTNQALSISQTAELCGFSNPSHFSRYFKSTAAVHRRNGVLVLSKTTGIMGVEPTAVIIRRGENHD